MPVLEPAMKVTRECIFAAAVALLAGGCGGAIDISWSGNASVSRNNDNLTVALAGEAAIEGSAKIAEEKRPVAAFHTLAAHHGIQVLINDASVDSLTVEADDNLLQLVETKVENETLQVRITKSLTTRNPIRVTVGAKQLSNVSATSSARITARKLSDDLMHVKATSSGQIYIDDVQGEQIELVATSSGQVTAKNVEGKKLRVTASSSGRVAAAGNVDEQQVEASSSGNYDARQLSSRLARVDCSSSGSAVVRATQEVVGSASSSGSVRYAGDPAKLSVTTSSAGSVAKTER
jgi:hypothetical protein